MVIPNIETNVSGYQNEGWWSPIEVLRPDEVAQCREGLETYEASVGHPIEFPEKSKSYLLFEWADYLVHHPKVLDAVEAVIGPDILVYHSTTWIKEAQTPAFVHWHQDGTYFFLEPHLHVTAWVAISDCPPESGWVRVISGSHKLGQFQHNDDPGQWNMIKRGQGIFDQFDEGAGVLMPLRAGEMSLHHTDVVHSSAGNETDHRRVGIGISYIPTSVRPVGEPTPSALLVRGKDNYGNFVQEKRLGVQQSPEAIAAHDEANTRFRARQDLGAKIQ
ncbi:MAG: phytanoyl-CoA dioxygenase [Actinobacteria bacterium]|nr:phytanoyl-CoA dioxygenase [Actinomycetota bacterium]